MEFIVLERLETEGINFSLKENRRKQLKDSYEGKDLSAR